MGRRIWSVLSRALPIAPLVLLAALAGFGLGYLVADREPPQLPVAEVVEPVPGERALELAEVRRVQLRLSATDDVQAQLAEANALLRNRLAAAGLTVVDPGQPSDATVVAHLDSHHFSAFDAHAVAVELHLSGQHHVRISGELRLIPHDIWHADTLRLVQPDAIPREVVQSLDELAQYLTAAVQRARNGKR